MKTIKSFVLRAGRVSKRQQFAIDNWLSEYILPLETTHWNLATIFGRQADTVVEVGYGMGASLLTMAKQNPQINYIGIEVHQAGIGSLAADLHDNALSNVRLVTHDAVEVFKQQVAPASLTSVQIFFPDPWHRKRHHKRRLIQTDFVHLLVQSLKPEGLIHCATDWQDYAEQMLAVFNDNPELINGNATGGFSAKPQTRPLTKFEQRGNRLGHDVWDLLFSKKKAL